MQPNAVQSLVFCSVQEPDVCWEEAILQPGGHGFPIPDGGNEIRAYPKVS